MKSEKKEKWNKLLQHIFRYVGIRIVLELIIESLNHKSITAGFQYMIEWPSLFIFNTLIIMLTVSVALFFKREIFVFTVISAVWLIFGIVNFIILSFRVTPFSAVDITLLESAISVSGHYLNAQNIAMIIVAVILVLVSMICLYRKAPKHSHTTQKKLIMAGICVALISMAIFFLRNKSNSVQALSNNYTNISEAYENYGFVYCFTNSIIDTGISKPADYSQENVQKILSGISGGNTTAAVKPNIIFVQLESFFDVNTLKSLKLSQDALPNFHKLQQNFSHGLLTVPTIGAGTVNTEFEVLTGMSQKDFGTSEYPYKTVLRDTTAESICYDLKKLGYTSHCVHNNEGTFSNLGFDSFTSMEYMNGLEDNPNGWKKDKILTKEIINTLNNTAGADFTLGITVQSHGKYTGFEAGKNAPIKVKKAPEGMEESYAYYVNQLYEVDQMIGELTAQLSSRQEKTVLVLYGDHLPSLDIKKKDLKDTNLYQTQYVIWDNMGLTKEDENLSAYQLYPEVLNRLGIHEGNLTKFHQSAEWKTKTYHENLKMLEYDMLYGDNFAYQGNKPYQMTNLHMGTGALSITDVVKNEKGYLVSGVGFTPYCHILFNGKEIDAEWVDESHLQITEAIEYDAEAAAQAAQATPVPQGTVVKKESIPNAFFVKMKTDGGTVLSESEVVKWENTSLAK